MSELECGCRYRCRCDARIAADKAAIFLKMAGLDTSVYLNYGDDGITLAIQPYEYFYTYKGRGYWSLAHLRYITYGSVEGLEKGVNRLIQRKTAYPDYLELPKTDSRGHFNLPPKGKQPTGRFCRLVKDNDRLR